MNAVERVKSICKERKIPISKLESDLGFSNGYISSLKKGTFPDDRIRAIAKYFDLSVDYLMTGKEDEEDILSAHLAVKIRQDAELIHALEKYFNLSETKRKHVVELINLLSE